MTAHPSSVSLTLRLPRGQGTAAEIGQIDPDMPCCASYKTLTNGLSIRIVPPNRTGLAMKVGILSDTHDQVARTAAAVALLVDSGAEALIHCGDITVPQVVYEMGVRPSYFVFGNCDDDVQGLGRAIASLGGTCLGSGGLITLGGRRLAVTHGHLEGELQRLEAMEPHYLFTGHTHCRDDRRRGKTRWINPGALHRARPWTVALLDLESDELSVLIVSGPTAAI